MVSDGAQGCVRDPGWGAENRTPPATAMCPMAKRRGHCKIKYGESVNEPSAVVLPASPSHVALTAALAGRMGQRAGTPKLRSERHKHHRGNRNGRTLKCQNRLSVALSCHQLSHSLPSVSVVRRDNSSSASNINGR